jgi:hypothetical protein
VPFNIDGKTCLVCHRLIPMPRKRDQSKVFCDRRCVSVGTRGVEVAPCARCGKATKQLANEASSTGRVRFCSRACANKNREVTYTRTCARCGGEFRLDNIAYERRGKGQFCSVSCATRQYSVDEHYFDEIDTEVKAYWLGFLDADGYQNGREMIVNLNAQDAAHLQKLRVSIRSEHPVRLRADAGMVGGFTATFRVSSQILCSGLNRWGCVQAKSLIVQYPQELPAHLHRHFIRGVFDGDGCISQSKQGYWRWCIFSENPTFSDGVATQIQMAGQAVTRSRKDGGRFVNVSNRPGIRWLYSYLYDDASVWLDRKKFKFQQACLELQPRTSSAK